MDKVLRTAVEELKNGLLDADLGGHVYKKRSAWVAAANVAVYEP